jgi:hypothetical protein
MNSSSHPGKKATDDEARKSTTIFFYPNTAPLPLPRRTPVRELPPCTRLPRAPFPAGVTCIRQPHIHGKVLPESPSTLRRLMLPRLLAVLWFARGLVLLLGRGVRLCSGSSSCHPRRGERRGGMAGRGILQY